MDQLVLLYQITIKKDLKAMAGIILILTVTMKDKYLARLIKHKKRLSQQLFHVKQKLDLVRLIKVAKHLLMGVLLDLKRLSW